MPTDEGIDRAEAGAETDATPTAGMDAPAGGAAVSPMPSWREWLVMIQHRPAGAALGGLLAGALVGGIGGRLAMLLLRLTSSDSVRGVTSDDGFVIGQVTRETFGLIAFAAVGGLFVSMWYLVLRRWLPAQRRPVLVAVFLGVTGGAAVIEPGGVDFTFLSPLWLAVLLFVVLPAVFGAVMVTLVEWLLADPDRWRFGRTGAMAILVLPLLGPGVVIALVAGGIVLAARRWPDLARRALDPVPTAIVRLGLFALFVLGAAELWVDVRDIL